MPGELIPLDARNAHVRFSVRWFGVWTVRGEFDDVDGSLQVQPDGGSVQLSVGARSVRTGVALRDRHLARPRFLGAAQDERITFTGLARLVDGAMELTGELRLRGRTRTLHLLPVFDAGPGRPTALWTVHFRVARRDHGVGVASGIAGWNPLLWAIASHVDIQVSIVVPVTAPTPQPASVRAR